jgi:uncharacterized damage-inducible protein DinB
MEPTPVSRDYLQTLVGYHVWAGRRLLDAAGKLTPEELQTGSPSSGTIFNALRHILDVSYSWRKVIEGTDDGKWVWDVESLEDLTEVRASWEAENRRLAVLVASMRAEDLDREAVKQNWPGHPFRPWQIVVHLVSHQVEHANEVGWRLTELGHSPGGMGFIAYVDQIRGR